MPLLQVEVAQSQTWLAVQQLVQPHSVVLAPQSGTQLWPTATCPSATGSSVRGRRPDLRCRGVHGARGLPSRAVT